MKLLLSFFALLFFSVGVLAQQPGANDLTFNTIDGALYGDGSGFDDLVKTTSLQADGKIIAGGWFDKYNGTPRSLIARVNPDGSNDPTFNIGAGFYGLSSEYVASTVIQPDGKILAGGEFAVFNVTNRKNIARLNSDGTLDASFNPGTGFNNAVYSIALQSDGKILVGGPFTQYNGTTINKLVRLNPNGTIDATFNIGTGFNGIVYTITIQPDGKILAGGSFTNFNGTAINRIIRLNPNGTMDATFNPGSGFSYTVQSIAVQSDNKLVIGGEFPLFNGVSTKNIARLNADGSLDPTFNVGTGFNYYVKAVRIQPDGKILVAGEYWEYNGLPASRIIRLNTDGTRDLTFNPGAGFIGDVNSIAMQPNGKIVAVGDFSLVDQNPRIRIARLNTDGSLDTSFNTASGSNGQVVESAVQPDGKILISGDFVTFNQKIVNRIARLNSDGSLDTTFHTGTGFDYQPASIMIQPDGKIVIGGSFTMFNGVAVNRIIRLNANGTLDNTFTTTGTGPNSIVSSTSLQPDGKIIVGGYFSSFSSTSKNRIARVNADGTLDPTFNPGTGFDNWVYETKLQPDGKVVVGGAFLSYRSTSRNRIARVNPNGTLDTGFHVGTVDASVSSIIVQPDGKIVVGGSFTYYQGNRNYITRVNTDGSNDPTFSIGTGFNSYVHTMVIQADGKIIVGGDFTSYNGTAINRIARLNTDGTLDATFNPAPGFNDWVYTVSLQPDGKVIAGGKFTALNGSIPRTRVARLLAVCTLTSTASITNVNCSGNANGSIDITPGTGIMPYTFDWGGGITTEDRTGLTAGTYSVTITDAAGCNTAFNYTVTQPNVLSASTDVTHVSCLGGANGTINLIPAGGTIPYTFSWNDGITTEDRTGLTAATYSVNITDANGCTTSSGAVITQPAVMLSATTSQTNIACFGGNTGAIDLAPSGGVAPYTFTWNDGSTNEDRTGLSAGSYSVVVSDAAGCSITVNAMITQASAGFTVASNVTPVSCFNDSNGAIDLTLSGGVLPYSFNWENGASTEDRTGLTAGTYSVTITDANGCSTVNFTLTEPTALTATTTISPVSCFGASNGSIDLTPAGGTTPYTFDWGSGITSEDRTGISAGNYSVLVTDFNGCSITLSPSVAQAAAITNSFSATACYTYSWNAQTYNSSGSYQQVFTAANGCDSTVTLSLTINQATTSTLTQTACNSFTLNGQTYTTSGTYTQNLTNAAGCDSTLTLNLTVKYATSSSITQTVCNSFTLNGQTYITGGTYIQNLTNAAGCDSTLTLTLTVNYANSSLITETACNSFTLNGQTYTSTGIYTQNFTNVAGCDSTLTLDLTIHTDAVASMTQTACGSFTLNGQTYTSSGTYVQNLSTASGCDSTLTLNLIITHPTSSSMSQTACGSFTLNGQTYASSGTYTQNLVNAAGCDSTLTLNLTIQPLPLVTAVDNGTGSITASSTNSYQWINCANGAAIAGAVMQTFSPLTDGTYAVIGTSANGCSDTSDCVIIDYLGIEEQLLFDISIAPNPTEDEVRVQFDGGFVNLVIRDPQSKIVFTRQISSGEQISLKNYADGVYLFELNSEKGKVIKRVVKN